MSFESQNVELGLDGVEVPLVEPTRPVPERSRSWKVTFLWCAFQVSLVFLSIVSALIVAWRWIKYGVDLATMRITQGASDLYGLLDYLSPSATPEVREEKVREVESVILSLIARSRLADLLLFSWIDLSFCVLGVTVAASSGYLSLRWLGFFGKRAIQRMRGIQFEAVREGSMFRSGPIPAFQVAFMQAGLLMDKHIGYGIRYGDYLVIPRHVLEEGGEVLQQGLLSGPKGKVLASWSVVQSRALDDLVYCYIDPRIWSQLGASKAKLADKFRPCHAVCSGEQGQTTGRLSKSPISWLITYSGSTVPGMSGAPYVMQGQVQGIHQGNSGRYNMGIAASLIVFEMKKICLPESSEDLGQGATARPRFFNTDDNRLWQEETMAETLADRWADDDWALGADIDYHRDLQWERMRSERRQPEQQSRVTFDVPAAVRLTNQSDGESQQVMSVLTARSAGYLDQMQRIDIVRRVADLENSVAEHAKILSDILTRPQADRETDQGAAALPAERREKQSPVVEKSSENTAARIPCSFAGCGKTFRDDRDLQKHQVKHDEKKEKFPCPHCAIACRSTDALARHMTVHTKTRYTCSVCSQECRTARSLNNHCLNTHKVRGESAIPTDTGSSGRIVRQESFLGNRSNSRRSNKGSSSRSSSQSNGATRYQPRGDNLSGLMASQASIESSLKELLQVMGGLVSAIERK